MVKRQNTLVKFLLAAFFAVGGAVFLQNTAVYAAFDAKYEWVNNQTIKLTYRDDSEGDNQNKTVELKLNGANYIAEDVPYNPPGIGECNYDIMFTPSGTNKSAGQIDNRRVRGQPIWGCEDQLIANGAVAIGAADKADDDPSAADGSGEEAASSCKIDGIGWIVCPIVGFLGMITDAAQWVVVSMLETQPLNISTENNPTYQVWSIARNIANVLFVIAFMLIIFSQLTSVGLGNYGIKKMLPRLIVAGILVNVSYWICAILVDLSNIVGASVFEMFKGIVEDVNPNEEMAGAWSGQGDRYATLVGGVLAGTLAGGAMLYFGLTALLPLLITAAAAIVLVVIVLTIRQALIVILIVVSPLAFVAFLLPNTENLFNKWKSLLTTMLVMFPVIALIFGGSALASEVIMYTAGQDNEEGTNAQTILIQIVGAFVAIIPLFITPLVMKTAGGVLNRIGGMVNNADKGIFDRARKGAAGLRESEQNRMRLGRMNRAQKALDGNSLGKSGAAGSRRRRLGAFVMSAGATTAKNREERKASEKGAADYAEASYFAKRARDEDGFAESITNGDKDRAASLQAGAVSTLDKLDAEDIKNREILIRSQNDPKNLLSGAQEELQRAVLNNDTVGARASLSILLNGGSKGVDLAHVALEDLEKNSGGHSILHDTTDGSVGSTLRSDISKAGLKGKDAVLNQWSYDSGVPVAATDEGGNVIYQKDSSGNFKLDAAGNKMAQTIERKDINGNTMYEMDAEGKDFKLDQNGNKIPQIVMRPRTLTEVAADKKVIQSLSDAETVGQTGGALKRASENSTIGQGQAASIQGNSSVQGALSEDKRAIFEKAAGGKFGPAAAPASIAPLPQGAGNTMRTNPNVAGTAGWTQGANGLVMPSGGSNTVATAAAAATGAAVGAAAANRGNNRNNTAPTQPIVVTQPSAPTQQYPQQPQQQQQNRQPSGPAPVVSTAAAAAMGAAFGSTAGTMGNNQTIQIQNADISGSAQAPIAAPTPPVNIPTSTSGAGATNTNDYTRYTSQKNDNVTVNQTIVNNIENKIQSAGGVNKMTTQEIIDGIGQTQNLSGASGTHDKLRREFGRRRGFDGPASPAGPSGPPSSPLPPQQ